MTSHHDNSNNGPAMNEQEINLLELLQVIVGRRRMIICVTSSVAVLAIIASLLIPNKYLATAKILPPPKDSGGGIAALLGGAGGLGSLAGSLGFGSSGTDLYLGILKSRSVSDAVIKRLDLARIFEKKTPEETRKVLEKVARMQATKDGIITITTESKDPKLAAAIANTFVEELGKKSVQLNLTKAGTERIFLEKRLVLVKEDLKKAEEALKTFSESNKTIKVDSQAAATIEGIARIRAELVAKEVQLNSLKSYLTDESSEVKMLKAGIDKLRSQLNSQTATGSGSNSNVIPNAGNVPNLGLEYARRYREVKIQEAIFEQLTKQYELAKLTEAKDSSALQILDEAVVPLKKSSPKRAMIVILSTVTAMIGAISFAFVSEYLSKMPQEEQLRLQGIKRSLFDWRKES
jgi:uncharacterized protein involved in exopolysaccharide biosynthesis